MKAELFDFELPEERIALKAVEPRDAARLLVVDPDGPAGDAAEPSPPQRGKPRLSLTDTRIDRLAELLRPGDAIILNDTRVIRAALRGERLRGGERAIVSFNLHKRVDESRWRAFARPAKRLRRDDRIRFGHDGRVCLLGQLEATVTALGNAGEVELSFSLHGPYLDEAIETLGDPPLPPYIASRRGLAPEDAERYQTIYARHPGAVAAPTAGLHFTPALLATLAARGISRHFLTLHVGAGTFLPVKAQDTAGHRIEPEWGEISAETARALNSVRDAGGRIVAVGGAALRMLETAG